MVLLNSPRSPKLRDLLLLFYCLDVILALATVALGLLWSRHQPFWLFDEADYEPATVVAGGLLAVSAGISVVLRYILGLRAPLQTPPSREPVTELWAPTNHSKPAIPRASLNSAERNLIATAFRRYYRSRTSYLSFASRIDEYSVPGMRY